MDLNMFKNNLQKVQEEVLNSGSPMKRIKTAGFTPRMVGSRLDLKNLVQTAHRNRTQAVPGASSTPTAAHSSHESDLVSGKSMSSTPSGGSSSSSDSEDFSGKLSRETSGKWEVHDTSALAEIDNELGDRISGTTFVL